MLGFPEIHITSMGVHENVKFKKCCSILSIENDITSQLDFNDIITDFAFKKSRKKALI